MLLGERFEVLERVSRRVWPASIEATLIIDEAAEDRAFEVHVHYEPHESDVRIHVTSWWTMDLVRQPITSANSAVVEAIERYVECHPTLFGELFELWKSEREDLAIARRVDAC